MEREERKPGVAADWTRLPAHLCRSLPGLIVESSERLAVGQRWLLRWEEEALQLDAYVYRHGEGHPLSSSNIGGDRSSEEVGELLVEFDFKPDLLWQFKNVTLHLRGLAEDEPDERVPAGRAQRIQLAKAVQAFLESSLVSDLDQVTPKLELQRPEEETILLGSSLPLAYRAVNAAPDERHLEVQSDGLKIVTQGDTELIVTPERVGPVGLWLSLRNTRTLLRSPFTELSLQSVRERGRTPVRVQARYVEDARLEEGVGLRLRLDRDPHSRNSETVFVIALDEQRTVVFQFGGPRHSNAPRGIAMKLQKALLLDGARSPVPLASSAFHIEPRRFPDIQGTISWASDDWEIAAVSAGSLADSPWMEELNRRGLAIAERAAPGE